MWTKKKIIVQSIPFYIVGGEKEELTWNECDTWFFTLVSSPPLGTMTTTEPVANSSILALTAQLAVRSVHVVMTGWQRGTTMHSVTNDKRRHKVNKTCLRRWCGTNPFHSGSQTSRWHRSNRRGPAGRSEAPCSSGGCRMIAGSFGQTFLLGMLHTMTERKRIKYLFRLPLESGCIILQPAWQGHAMTICQCAHVFPVKFVNHFLLLQLF